MKLSVKIKTQNIILRVDIIVQFQRSNDSWNTTILHVTFIIVSHKIKFNIQ
jgi:hypothetical protein